MSSHPSNVTEPPYAAHTKHLDRRGCCNCDCSSCATKPSGSDAGDIVCICPDCNTARCASHGEASA